MKRKESKKMVWTGTSDQRRNHEVITRLDESLPLETEEWLPVERLLVRLTEFAPKEMLVELSMAIASFADDQARLAYILGQEDMLLQLHTRAA